MPLSLVSLSKTQLQMAQPSRKPILLVYTAAIPEQFGEFGGKYVPGSPMDCLSELEAGVNKIKDGPIFWEEYRTYCLWMGRPGHLHLAY
jgi:hypothetical protein